MIRFSKPISPLVSSCYEANGELDVNKFLGVSGGASSTRLYSESLIEEEECQKSKQKKKRGPKGSYDEESGKWVKQDPKDSTWYKVYILSNNCSTIKKNKRKFRRRFRMPHHSFKSLVKLCRDNNWFPKVEKPDAVGQVGAPLELLILGSLRYLGRGWTFDDLEEATNISEETHRRFSLQFFQIGATHLFDKWVTIPQTKEEIDDCMFEFKQAGFNGCVGSSDATHVIHERVSARLKNNHLGMKAAQTTRAFNITVNHRRRILATSPSCPGRWNDKTLIRYDKFLTMLHAGELYSDVEYMIIEDNGLLPKAN